MPGRRRSAIEPANESGAADLFVFGSYAALNATGPAGDRICVFSRTWDQGAIVAAAVLFPQRATMEG
jgi:hypothetical protein